MYDYKQRENGLHLEALKYIIQKIHLIEPKGIIVFVQNYKYLDVVKQHLKDTTISEMCIYDNKN